MYTSYPDIFKELRSGETGSMYVSERINGLHDKTFWTNLGSTVIQDLNWLKVSGMNAVWERWWVAHITQAYFYEIEVE